MKVGNFITNIGNYKTTRVNNYKQQTKSNIAPQYAQDKTIYPTMINFKAHLEPKRTVMDIDLSDYYAMRETTKKRYRKKYNEFASNPNINKEDLVDKKYQYLPLRSEEMMDEFLKTAKIYSKFKDHEIICLGRSPKWFLNAALWMKDGIDNYKYVAFSKYWYTPDKIEGVRKLNRIVPSKEQETAYRHYLKQIQADPISIVKKAKEKGKKVIITDYICSGKGATSFLDLLGRYAKDQGVLEELSKSIYIVGIGSMDYMEQLNQYADSISEPRVIMPEVLWPYEHNIKQEFHNMNYGMFMEMLINQNTNECRSTYYPAEAWLVYRRPDKFKTGIITDMKKIEQLLNKYKEQNIDKDIVEFKPVMRDYRNLLNFRILDALYTRDLLKKEFQTKP